MISRVGEKDIIPWGKIKFASFYSQNLFTVAKKNHLGGIKGTKFKFISRDLDVFFPNRTDHYFPQELSLYTQEGKNNFLPQEGKKIIRLVSSNKIYVLIIVMFEWY